MLLFLFLFSFPFLFLKSQTYQTSQAGLSIGISLDLGTHINRMGLFASGYYLITDRLQGNASLRTYLTFRGYGPKGMHDELQFSAGALYGYGPNNDSISEAISVSTNHTIGRNYFAYAYNFYLDNIGTSQRTGTIGIGISNFEFILENDAFADPILDRFRTGSFQAAYSLDTKTRVAISSLLWTGDPAAPGRTNVRDESYPARFGCLSLAGTDLGRISHGILALQVQRTLPLGQIARLDLGIDAEQVRHLLQNKLIHDVILLPEKWVSIHNRHIPMLDTEGLPFLFKEGQKIRKPKPYGKLSLNPGIFF